MYDSTYESLDINALILDPDSLNNKTSAAELIINGKNESPVTATKKEPLHFSDLPSLITNKIFSYLDLQDLGRCAQVSWSWNIMVYEPHLWRTISPVKWAE
ncbi:hypothetical protein L9F63_023758, partial [Diploptera punctata]